MENINSVVADNLKRFREERKLSLEAMAKLSGVSKSMLGQIERGEANPTVSTVWKIANGLKVSFTDLMTRPEKDYEVVDIKRVEPLLEDGGLYRDFPVFPFDAARRFEMLHIEIDPRRPPGPNRIRLARRNSSPPSPANSASPSTGIPSPSRAAPPCASQIRRPPQLQKHR